MTRLSTLPSTREQARHALLLLGAPAPARLIVDVHAALFDGDLSVPALAALLRAEERGVGEAAARPDAPGTGRTGDEPGGGGGAGLRPYLICPGLGLDLAPVRGMVTLSGWGVGSRICTPGSGRADALAMVARIAEFATVRPGPCTAALLRQLAGTVPGGLESFDPLRPAALAHAARAALDDPALVAAVAAEEPARAAATGRAERLSEDQRLFGVPAVPHQRGGA